MRKIFFISIIFSSFIVLGARAEDSDCGEGMYSFENMCIDRKHAYALAGTECAIDAEDADMGEARLGVYAVNENSVECVELWQGQLPE